MEFLLVLRWLLVFALLTATGAPLAALLFPRLPRRGAAFALPAALVPLALVVFWVGQATFGSRAVLLGALVVGSASVAAYLRGGVPDWTAVGGGYAVFSLGFLLLVLFRAYDPGVTPAGGEQFLHYGLVNALLRAEALPPEDFWFAGEPLRYYYGTQMQVAAFALLTDTHPRFGFNLGIAVFYGVLFVTAYGLAGSVVESRGCPYHLGGALGAFFVAVGGALTTSVRLAFGLLPEDVALRYGRPVFDAVRHMPYEEAVVRLSNPAEWGWFYTRYVVPGTLQEFPLYSFVKADLHGHALSNGYVLFAAALAFSYYRTPAPERLRRLGIVFGGLGVVAGVFGFMNTWSLPTAVGLAWLAMAAAGPHPATLLPGALADRLSFAAAERGERGVARRVGAELWRVALAGALASLVGVVGVALASPFLVFGHVPANDGVGLFPPRTSLWGFLTIYGGVLALFGTYVSYYGWPTAERYDRRVRAVGAATLLGVAAALVVLVDFAVLAATGPLLLAAWWLVRTDRVGFEAVLLVAGVGLLLSMDVVYAKVWPPTQIRWNTTLKVAVQGWTLAAAGVGAASALLLSDARDRLFGSAGGVPAAGGRARSAVDGGGRIASRAVPAAVALVVVLVLLTSSAFGVLVFAHGVAGPADERDATLDGLAVHERWHGPEMEAIAWLNGREGNPRIVETPGHETYHWTSPASTMTGLPSVVGWDHQRGYRGDAAFERRAGDVDVIYAGEWEYAAPLLRQYDVKYVWVGPNERERYGDDLREFERHEGVTVAFENEEVTVYEVDGDALADDGSESGSVVAEPPRASDGGSPRAPVDGSPRPPLAASSPR